MYSNTRVSPKYAESTAYRESPATYAADRK